MHNINFNIETQTSSFVSAKVPAWHKLGAVLPQNGLTSEECIKYANLDFKVTKQPLKATFEDGSLVDVPEMFATVRSDNKAILGIVGNQYVPLQNQEAFGFFDPLIAEGEAFYETCGLLGAGERLFITAKLPAHIRIGNTDDIIEQYIFLTNSHDGKSSVVCAFTPIRIVCANTLNAALRNCTNRLSIRHTTNMAGKIKTAHEIMGLQNLYTKELEAIFNTMATKTADEKVYEKVIVTALADNKKMIEDYFEGEASTRFIGNVNKAMEYAFSDDTQTMFTSTRNTLFGAYNAVTGFNANVTSYQNESSAVIQQVDPSGRANIRAQKAFELCLELSKN